MMLYENFYEACQMLDKQSVQDEFGTFHTTWVPGAKFMAAVIKDKSLAARTAEKEGVKEVYTVTAPKGVDLDFHDAFTRLEGGATFRVTTNSADSKTPDAATFAFTQTNAERWEIPK